ncbi:MAG: MATE family efflux transporter [Bacteroidales bacterium]|nr:MATE family efflux transporter [Bacteroidales bacterium]HES58831.1 MATE family efflux transporter [Caldithrix sp.]
MQNLSEGNSLKVILNFTMPMLIGNVFQQLYNVIDSIIVGNFLGKEALSAVGASFPVMFALISLVIGIASGSTIIISQYFGAKDFQKVKIAIDTMYVVIFVASILISIIGISFSEDIFRLIELPETIIPQAKTYLNIILAGIIMMFGSSGTNAVLRGLGDSKTPLYFLVFASILNIIFDLLFVLVFKLGIEGVAIATVLSQAIAFLSAVVYLNKYHELINISLTSFKIDKDIFIKSVKIGLPSGLQNMFVAVGMIAIYRIVNQFDTNVIAAYSVAGRIDSFAIMPAMNFSMALTVFVGQNIGAGKMNRVWEGLKATLLLTSIISITFSLIAVFFGKYLMRIFTPDEAVQLIGYNYLVIVGLFYIIFSAMFSFNAVYRGAGDTIVPMFITLFALWFIRIPFSWFLSQKIGETGIWWGIPIAWAFGLTISAFYFASGRWKRKSIIN